MPVLGPLFGSRHARNRTELILITKEMESNVAINDLVQEWQDVVMLNQILILTYCFISMLGWW